MTAMMKRSNRHRKKAFLFHPAQTFERITGDEAVTGVDFMDVKSFTFDENRRAIIEKVEGSEHHIDGDTVIFAVGQRPDITPEAGLELGRGNSITVKENSLAASVDGIFAAGDMHRGSPWVVWAIREGRKAAEAVDASLMGYSNL